MNYKINMIETITFYLGQKKFSLTPQQTKNKFQKQ